MKRKNNIPKVTFVTREIVSEGIDTDIFIIIINIQKLSFFKFLNMSKKIAEKTSERERFILSKLN